MNTITVRKSVNQIISDELPQLAVSILEVGDRVLYYDENAHEDEIERLKAIIARLKLNITIKGKAF